MNRTTMKRGNKRPSIRKIHINLPEEVHQKLRVKCALEDVTIQEFVERLIMESVDDVKLSVGNETRKARK
jgi:predicted HicB family RNase H-like nuclease